MVGVSELMLLNSMSALKYKFMENSSRAAIRAASLPQHGFGTRNAQKMALLQNQQRYNAMKAHEMMLQEQRLLQSMDIEHNLERLRNTPLTLNVVV